MEPIPQTVVALRALRHHDGDAVLGGLRARAARTASAVEGLVAVALANAGGGLTFLLTGPGPPVVRSTLRLPIVDTAVEVGAVQLYACPPDAFDGRVEELAAVWDADAERHQRDTDLGLAILREAQRAPDEVRAAERVERAVSVLMSRHRVDPHEARARLDDLAVVLGSTDAAARHLVGDPRG